MCGTCCGRRHGADRPGCDGRVSPKPPGRDQSRCGCPRYPAAERALLRRRAHADRTAHSLPLPDRLRRREVIPPAFQAVPILHKPYESATLFEALRTIPHCSRTEHRQSVQRWPPPRRHGTLPACQQYT